LEFFGGTWVAWGVTKRPQVPSLNLFLAGTGLFLVGGWINESVYAGLIEQGYHVVPRVFVYGLPACMILAGLVRMERSGERQPENGHKAFRMQAPARFSALTGGASYATYLSHILILTVVWNAGFNEYIASWSGNMIIDAYVVLMLAILGYSGMHYSLLEKPLHQLFKRWIGLKNAPSRQTDRN